MVPKILRSLTLAGVVALAGSAGTAFGQCCLPNPFCCWCCPQPVRVQACYQTVPVTEMREVRQVVQRPVVDTKYVDQDVTEYRQVVENKTAEIPTVSYQNVTEYRTVQRDCGHWMTQLHHRPMVSPCEYDPRPDLFGFINRTGYSLRMAFTPTTFAERIYVPNVVAQQIPVTRQVAVRGSQTINYQVARVVPVTTTRKVAVNTVRMVAQEIVTQRPVTVYKTVPFGSSLAQGVPAAAPTTQTALQPVPDSQPTAILPRNSKGSSAPERISKAPQSMNDEGDSFPERGTNSGDSRSTRKNTDQSQGALQRPAAPAEADLPVDGTDDNLEITSKSGRPLGRWVARRKPKTLEGPAFPEIAQAGTGRAKR